MGNTHITVLHTFQTRVQSVSVPVEHEVHSAFKISGTVQVKDGSAWKAAPSVAVTYYDRACPTASGCRAGSGKTSGRGAFSWQARLIKLGHLAWQARVNGQQIGSNVYGASTSATKDSFFVERTYVNEIVALHLHGGTDFGAIMDDLPVSDGTANAVTGAAKFYYRAKGSSTWHYLGSDRTDRNGSVAISVGRTIDGYFPHQFSRAGPFPRIQRDDLPELNPAGSLGCQDGRSAAGRHSVRWAEGSGPPSAISMSRPDGGRPADGGEPVG